MVGAAVPCRPHGIGRGDQENVERGLDWIYRIVQDWGTASELSRPRDYDGREKSIR